MFSAKQAVIESNIPAASHSFEFKEGMSRQQARERADVNDWLEMQEDAELDLIMHEYSNKNCRSYRHDLSLY